ncbi:MAG: hypothetical protein IMZ47_00690 [Firmicutes bacterium]|nr:hypothetical protein [Bacillota bacterium]
MKQKVRANLLGIYDLVLALLFIYLGVMMIGSKSGLFVEYPKEWLTKLPFKSWVMPGVIAIVLFGLGNIVAAIFSFTKANTKSWFISAIMGGILFISLVAQIIVLGEWYLATVEFFVLSIIQLCISGYTIFYLGDKCH